MRINKFIAACNVASRRKAEEYILAGRVKINGQIITDLSFQVEDEDIVLFDEKRIIIQPDLKYYLLNKPAGIVSTAKDQFGRKSVVDFFDQDLRLYPVGRLDYDSRGLLIITNDGDLTYRLTHPKHNIDKTYIVKTDMDLSDSQMVGFKNGVDIGDFITSSCMIERISPKSYKVIISEGRNRQIRRMFSAFGITVTDLQRVAIGDLRIESIKEGQFEELKPEQIEYLKNL